MLVTKVTTASVVLKAEVGSAFTQLKTLLTKNKCEVTAENAPFSLSALQGSLWGVTPKTAKKTLKFQLSQTSLGTHISGTSNLSLNYVKLSVAGCVFAVLLSAVCVWISMDLNTFITTRSPNSWSWMINNGGYVNVQGALLLSKLTRVFMAFLLFTLALETAILVYVHRKVGEFAIEILEALPNITEG